MSLLKQLDAARLGRVLYLVPRPLTFRKLVLVSTTPTAIKRSIGEHTERRITERAQMARNRPGEQTAEAIGRRLLEIVVYDKCCRIGGTLTLDDLAETSEVGDWKMPDFRAACSYAAQQGWLIVEGNVLTLTMAGLAAA